MSDDYTADDLLVTRHEVLHAVACYFRLGAAAIRSVSRASDLKARGLAGCVEFDKSAAVFEKPAPLLAMDMAVIYLTPFVEFYRKMNPKGMAGCGPDIEQATVTMADAALRIAGKVEDPETWKYDWVQRAKRECEELLDSRMMWQSVDALELRLDSAPTLTGPVAGAWIAKALS